MNDLRYWIWLSCYSGLKPSTAMALLRVFNSPEDVFFANETQYKEVVNISQQELKKIKASKQIGESIRTQNFCQSHKVQILLYSDPQYPEVLKHIYDPPLLIFVLGDLPDLEKDFAITVVGTRSSSKYGVKQANKMGRDLAKAGGIIVTGLAAGIDSAAAIGALNAGGKVIGVLGNGINVVYPAWNGQLYRKVVENGALVTEFPPNMRPLAQNFPLRNRIMSALSHCTVVIEAPKKSGALITAARAAEQGKDVFVIPGNVDQESFEGSNALLKDGAIFITSALDVIREYPESLKDISAENKEEYDAGQNATKKVFDNEEGKGYIGLQEGKSELSQEELKIICVLSSDPKHIDDIVTESGIDAQTALASLTILELNGYVEQHSGQRFALLVT